MQKHIFNVNSEARCSMCSWVFGPIVLKGTYKTTKCRMFPSFGFAASLLALIIGPLPTSSDPNEDNGSPSAMIRLSAMLANLPGPTPSNWDILSQLPSCIDILAMYLKASSHVVGHLDLWFTGEFRLVVRIILGKCWVFLGPKLVSGSMPPLGTHRSTKLSISGYIDLEQAVETP